jgi:hypothetical protein
MDGILGLFARSSSGMKQLAFAMLSIVSLAACGGGGDNEGTASVTPVPQQNIIEVFVTPPVGYWEGTITDEQSVQRTARLIATDTGEFQLYMSPVAQIGFTGFAAAFSTDWLVAYAQTCCTTSSRAVTILRMGGLTNPGQLTRSSLDNKTLNGEITEKQSRYSFSLTYQPSSTSLTLDALAGTYTGRTAYQTTVRNWTLTIESNGRITGADDYGCQWSGSAVVSRASVFKLSLTAAGCTADPVGPKNGNYVALGRFVEAQANHPTYPGQVTIEFATFGFAWLGYRTLAR